MCDHSMIAELYACVLQQDIQKFNLTSTDIRTGIQNMKEVYLPDPTSLKANVLDVADYNDPAHRCAYLHKYAGIHTALIADMFTKVLDHNTRCLSDIIAQNGHFNICSIGGGPGCDIISILAVLNSTFGLFQVTATLVDCMIGWRQTFNSLVNNLRFGDYGEIGTCFSNQYLQWSYLESNLLGDIPNDVNQAIFSADLVTMVKFISACACKDTPAMIRNIFRAMKEGSLVLYIDNASGGFHQLVRKEAQACNMITIFTMKHEHYKNNYFNIKKFGYTPCLETTVTIHMWRKPRLNASPQTNQVDNIFLSQGQQQFANNIEITIANESTRNHNTIIAQCGHFDQPRPKWNDNIFKTNRFERERQPYSNSNTVEVYSVESERQPYSNNHTREMYSNDNQYYDNSGYFASSARGGSNQTFVRTQPSRNISRQNLYDNGLHDEETEEDHCGTCCVIS